MFENRQDAGKRLAEELNQYKGQPVVVLAIPNGGVPVAMEVASEFKAELDLIVSRKIPIPLSPEGGFGAIADDGTVILNEQLVRRLGLNRQQIEYEAGRVREEVKKRSLLYKGDRPLVTVGGKVAVLVDDGLASGITMMAAVQSVRRRRPKEVVVAVPVAAAAAAKEVERVTDRLVTCAIGYMPKFYISDFYNHWYDLCDEDVVQYLKRWRMRHFV